jgi:3-hydroxybenzoate 6-monooxygenase
LTHFAARHLAARSTPNEERTVRSRTAIVVGSGIGGLASALALGRQGIEVSLLEQAQAVEEFGAGLQIGPNAFAALEWLGVAETVKRSSVIVERMAMRDAITGEQVADIPLQDAFHRRFGNPYAVAHRSDLHSALYSACLANDMIQVHLNSRVASVTAKDDSCGVHTKDGRRFEAAALIGADGVRSVVRDFIVGDDPLVSGHAVFRAVVPADRMPQQLRWNAPVVWAGPNCHLVHYPIRGGEQYNLMVTFNRREGESWGVTEESRDEIVSYFTAIHPLLRRLLDLPDSWRRWITADRDPVLSWTKGNATLVGDAAHPMMHCLAQGACMALEDAVTLGSAVEATNFGSDTVWKHALKVYERSRVTRTARVVLSVREFGRLCHVSGVERLVRNDLWRRRIPDRFYDALEWLYSWRPDACLDAAA